MVVEVPSTGEEFVVRPRDINANIDVSEGDYPTRAADGTYLPLGNHSAGMSVRAVLQRVLTDRFPQVESAVVTRDPASHDDLDKADLQAPGTAGYPFAEIPNDTGRTPMFWVEGGVRVSYNRPLRTDPADTNAVPNSFTSFSAPLVVQVTLAPVPDVVKPVIRASPDKVSLGKPVRFSISSYDGTQPTERLRYYWSFGDTTDATTDCHSTAPGSTSRPSHTYRAQKTYQVILTVCGSHTSGASDPITVKVDPVKSPDKPPGSTPPKKPPKTKGLPGGSDDSNGTNGNGTPSPHDGNGGDGEAVRQGANGARQQRRSVDLAAGTENVSGVLLDASAARSVTIRTPEAAPVAAARARPGGALPRDWRWLLALIPLALLLGGVARQTPWLAGRLPRPPWRDV